MPYKSKAQAAYFNIHRRELEAQGVNVDEWNAASRGKKLPQRVKKQSGGEIPLPRKRPRTLEPGYGNEYPNLNDQDDPIAKILRRGRVSSLGEDVGNALREGVIPPELLYMQKGIDPLPYQGDKNTIDPQYLGRRLDLHDNGAWPESYEEGGGVRYFRQEDKSGNARHGLDLNIPLNRNTDITGKVTTSGIPDPRNLSKSDFDARIGISRRFADGGMTEPFGGEMSDLAQTDIPPQAFEPMRKLANVLDESPENYGGRTSALFRLGSHLAGSTVDSIKNLMGESERLRTTGEYEGGPGFEAALNTAGASMPFAVRGALGNFGGRMYSAAERAVRESKTAKATPEQWMGELKNKPGVRPEELDYMGLPKFFEENQGQKITRGELASHMAQNRPEITEKTFGGVHEPYEAFKDEMAKKYGPYWDVYQLNNEERTLNQQLRNQMHDARVAGVIGEPPQYREYATGNPPEKNYRETAAVLPGREAGFQEVYNRARQEARRHGDVGRFDDDVVYRDQYMDMARAYINDENQFRVAHAPYPYDTLFHRRYEVNKPIEGKNTYVVHEFQSDLHQKAAKYGYRDPERIAHYAELQKAAEDRINDIKKGVRRDFPHDHWDINYISDVSTRDQVYRQLNRLPEKSPEYRKAVLDLFNAKESYQQVNRDYRKARQAGEYPERPFKGTWEELAAKRSIKDAVDTGHEQLAWYGGKDHAMQYGRMAEVPVHKWMYDETEQRLYALDKSGSQTRAFRVNLEDAEKMTAKDAPNMFSAENLAKLDKTGRIISEEISHPRLVGAEHHYQRYDQRMPKIMEKIGKKWGVKPEKIEVEVPTSSQEANALEYRHREGFEAGPPPQMGENRKTYMYRMRFTPEMIEEIKKHGLPMQRGGAVSPFLYKRANGGSTPGIPFNPQRASARQLVRNGLLHSNVAGRTDKLNIKTPSGAYVIPADVVSGIGQGNTLNGATALKNMLATGPLGMKTLKGGTGRAGHAARIGTGKMIKGSKISSTVEQTYAEGGPTGDEMMAEEHAGEPTPIDAAGGEYLVHPAIVRRWGNGDLKQGHRQLDAFVLNARKRIIKDMQNLKPPVGSST